jgi:hypothetical protein
MLHRIPGNRQLDRCIREKGGQYFALHWIAIFEPADLV